MHAMPGKDRRSMELNLILFRTVNIPWESPLRPLGATLWVAF